jgi:hypothetical protein
MEVSNFLTGGVLLSQPLILLGLHYYRRLDRRWQIFFLGTLFVLIFFASKRLIEIIVGNISQPAEWDFLCFWIYAKVAVQGLNFYIPDNLREIGQSLNLNLSAAFVQEVLDTSFRYPPPSIFLFAPLGWFDVYTALKLWYIFHLIILLLSVFILWQLFLKSSGWIGLITGLELVLTFRGTGTTFQFAQTNFLLLLMTLLFWRDRKHPLGGVWLSIGIFTKPFLSIFLVYQVLRKYWRSLVGTFVSLCGAVLLTILTFGLSTFLTYFRPRQYGDLPSWVYTQDVNQSLLATILRLTNYNFTQTSPILHPAFIISATLLFGITAWLLLRLKSDYDDIAFTSALLLALLIYPGTLTHYSILLLTPILILWAKKKELIYGVWTATALITTWFIIIRFSVFTTNLIMWIALSILGIGSLLSKRSVSKTESADNSI